MNYYTKIPVYAINLKRREDRKRHIEEVFTGRCEFDLTIVKAIEEENGRLGLWKTIIQVVQIMKANDADFGIICEDDHFFTQNYSCQPFLDSIELCQSLQADALLGGVSWFQSCVPITGNICWIERFTGLQFFIVYRRFYEKILNAPFSNQDAADLKIWEISKRIFVFAPFISEQQEFGYSDTTERNNKAGVVRQHFINSSKEILSLSRLFSHYQSLNGAGKGQPIADKWINLPLPILYLNLPIAKTDDFNAFKILNEYCPLREDGKLNYAFHIIINMGFPFFIIARNKMVFDPVFSPGFLRGSIEKCAVQNVDCLCGGCDTIGQAIPVTSNRMWISSFSGSSFVVVFSSYYEEILKLEEDITSQNLDYWLSKKTINKMILLPFMPAYAPDKQEDNITNNNEALSRLETVRNVFETMAYS